jgi:hypothetical protein
MTPREETNLLLGQAHNAAKSMLEEGGDFDPFALVLMPSGETQIVNALLDPREPSTIEAKVEYAHHVLRQMANSGEAKATALIGMMQLRLADREGFTDGFVLEIEHADDKAVNFYVPYEWQGSTLVLSAPIAKLVEPQIFSKKSPPTTLIGNASTAPKKKWWQRGG